MKPYFVSVPHREVVAAYAEWRGVADVPVRTVMDDGWTLPALYFEHLYEAQAASLDLAMVSGSLRPMQPHDVLISEFHGEPTEQHS